VRRGQNIAVAREEYEELLARLNEAEQALRAIRGGDVDAIVVAGPSGEQIFTLRGADAPYRTIVEELSEGIATLHEDGTVLFANRRFAEILGVASDAILGASVLDLFGGPGRVAFDPLLRAAPAGRCTGELIHAVAGGTDKLCRVVLAPLPRESGAAISLVLIDHTER